MGKVKESAFMQVIDALSFYNYFTITNRKAAPPDGCK